MKSVYAYSGLLAVGLLSGVGCSSGLPEGPDSGSHSDGSADTGEEGGGGPHDGEAKPDVTDAKPGVTDAKPDDANPDVTDTGSDVTDANPDVTDAGSDGDGAPGPATSVSVGFGQACSLTTNRDIECWSGTQQACTLSPSNTRDCSITLSTPKQVPTLTGNVAVVSTGGGGIGFNIQAYLTCAVTTVGGAWCWGDSNTSGQLGNGGTTPSSVPIPVSSLSTGVASVSVGSNSSACAVTTNGNVWCWGNNANNLLGNGTTAASSATPVELAGFTGSVVAVSEGFTSACALTAGGGVECWGDNTYGELGNNSTTSSAAPVQVSNLTSAATMVSVGANYACAIVSGAVECWGNNGFGQNLVPQMITGLSAGATAVSVGYNSACAVVGGGVWCWGDNSSGELGNGSPTNSAIPVQVTSLTSGVTDISVQFYGFNDTYTFNYFSACAVTSGDVVWCWGNNTAGSVPAVVTGL